MIVHPPCGLTLIDDWGDVIGMRGGGSNTHRRRLHRCRTPHSRLNHQSLKADGTSAGYQQHCNPMYALPTEAALRASVIISVAMGRTRRIPTHMYTRTAYFSADPLAPPHRPSDPQSKNSESTSAPSSANSAHQKVIILVRAGQLMNYYATSNIDEGTFDYLWGDIIVAMVLNAID